MFNKTIKTVIFIGILFLLSPVFGFGQSVCSEKTVGGVKMIVCEISEADPYPLGPIQIPNGAKVEIKIVKKSPFDECTLAEIKLTPIVEPDPIEKFLVLFTKTVTGSALPGGITTLGKDVNGNDLVPTNLTEKLIVVSASLAGELNRRTGNTGDFIKDTHKPLIVRIKTFVGTNPRDITQFNNNGGAVLFSDTNTVINNNKNELNQLSTKSLEIFISQSQATYELLSEQVKSLPNDNENVAKIINNLSIAKQSLDAIKTNFEAIKAGLTVFNEFVGKAETPVFEQKFPALLPYTQQTASTSVTCTNTMTKKAVFSSPVPITFLFKKDNPITVSVGPVFSTSPKQKLGITQINTGLNSMGQPSFRNEFAIVDKASYQVIPFAFINYRLMYLGSKSNFTKPPDFSLNISAGIGVNPNSGTNEVEYFVGPSVGYKRFFFQFGDHIGRFQKGFTGGFNIGDTVPASFPTTLPIQKEYRHRFGIGISYRLF